MGFGGGFLQGINAVAEKKMKEQRDNDNARKDAQAQVIYKGVEAAIREGKDPDAAITYAQGELGKVYGKSKEGKGILDKIVGLWKKSKGNMGMAPPPPSSDLSWVPGNPIAPTSKKDQGMPGLAPPPSSQSTPQSSGGMTGTEIVGPGKLSPPPSAQAPAQSSTAPTTKGFGLPTAKEKDDRALDLYTKQRGVDLDVELKRIKAEAEAKIAKPDTKTEPTDLRSMAPLLHIPSGTPEYDALGKIPANAVAGYLALARQEDKPTSEDTIAKALRDSDPSMSESEAKQQAGKIIADQARAKGKGSLPASVKEYEYVKSSQGFSGTFVDWLKKKKDAEDSDLSDSDLDAAAEQYYKTGVMPNLGWGKGLRERVMKRVGQLHPGKIDIALNKAIYDSNRMALENLVKNQGAVSVFASTARKNLDLFLETAQKVVDSGSPWINKPLRTIDEKLLGSDELAAMRAGRQVASNEIARVTTGNMSGSGIVTDKSRADYDAALSQDASLTQIIAAAGILRLDMDNREGAFSEEISDIQGRISNIGNDKQLKPPPNSNAGGSASTSVRVRDKNGRTGTYPGTAAEAKQDGYEVIDAK